MSLTRRQVMIGSAGLLAASIPVAAVAASRTDHTLTAEFPGGATSGTLTPSIQALIEKWVATHRTTKVEGNVEVVLQDGVDRTLVRGDYPDLFRLRDYRCAERLAIAHNLDINKIIAVLIKFSTVP